MAPLLKQQANSRGSREKLEPLQELYDLHQRQRTVSDVPQLLEMLRRVAAAFASPRSTCVTRA
jgi:hypothetical protein